MNVTKDTNAVTIVLTDEEASIIASVVGNVADNTECQAINNLYNWMLDLGVEDKHDVVIMQVQDFPEDDPTDVIVFMEA